MNGQYTTRLLTDKEYVIWDEFVDTCIYGCIFNKSHWLHEIFDGQGKIKLQIVGTFKDNVLQGGFAFGVVRKFSFFKMIVPPIYTSFNSILIKDRESKYNAKIENHRIEIIKEICNYLEVKYDYITVSFPPNFIDLRGFLWNGFSEKTRYTYIHHIRSHEEAFNNFEPSLKRQIRKGLKQDYRISFDFNVDEKKVSYDLLNVMSKRKNRNIYFDYQKFNKLLDKYHNNGNILLCNIYLKDRPVYTMVILLDRKTAYYWMAGGNYKYYNTGLNQLLMFRVLKELETHNYCYFDFVGANTEAIIKYKSGYNFKLTPYLGVEKVNNTFLKTLLWIKSIVKPTY
jgi:hypothetical protein